MQNISTNIKKKDNLKNNNSNTMLVVDFAIPLKKNIDSDI
jgi:hypothetical protein